MAMKRLKKFVGIECNKNMSLWLTGDKEYDGRPDLWKEREMTLRIATWAWLSSLSRRPSMISDFLGGTIQVNIDKNKGLRRVSSCVWISCSNNDGKTLID